MDGGTRGTLGIEEGGGDEGETGKREGREGTGSQGRQYQMSRGSHASMDFRGRRIDLEIQGKRKRGTLTGAKSNPGGGKTPRAPLEKK